MMWVIIVFTLVITLYLYMKLIKPLHYWRNKGVPYVKPWPILGNMASVVLRTQALGDTLKEHYNKFPNQRYYGVYVFSLPILVVKDPDLIKQIAIKDFDFFTDHYEFLPESVDPIWNKNLFTMKGKDWHSMRSVLSPAFTTSKMKLMFGFVEKCARDFVEYFEMQGDAVEVEMKDAAFRFATNVIAATAFGIDVNALRNRNDEFFYWGRKAFDFGGFSSLKFFGGAISPFLMNLFGIKFINRRSQEFFSGVIKSTLRQRDETGFVQQDMLHLLREAQKGRLKSEKADADPEFVTIREYNSTPKERILLTDNDIAAQAILFFFGGFHTVSTNLSQTIYELAVNPGVQEKLIQEIDKTLELHGGRITYEALLGMKYLNMVVMESLRLWPPALLVNRRSVKSYTIVNQNPNETPLHLEKGLIIWFPTFALHRDPKYYPNPEKFDPERFNDDNKLKIPSSAYIPFGLGPRNCIASRFAMLEAKMFIFSLLAKFKVTPTEKTQIPLVLSKKNINQSTNGPYWLALKRRIT